MHWTPALVHPKLTANHRIVQGDQVGQPAVLDRAGTPLLAWQTRSGRWWNGSPNPKAGKESRSPPTAVLQAGLAGGDTVLPCPGEARIGSRTIANDNHFQAGDVPLHTAFARSCNTTLAALAADLPADGLSRAADQLGVNADFVVPGLSTEAGKIEPADSTTQRVEDSISQGAVQTSPSGVALMTATVASGKAITPTRWRDLPTTVNAGYEAPPRAILDQVRAMMREVVTGGTATTLAGRGAVFGKTGTAQFGPDGTHAHGWFTGYRGDLAFAVLVLSGESSAPALSVANGFLAGN